MHYGDKFLNAFFALFVSLAPLGALRCMEEQNTSKSFVPSLKCLSAQRVYANLKNYDSFKENPFDFFPKENFLPTDVEQYIDSIEVIDKTVSTIIKKIYGVTDDKHTWNCPAQGLYTELTRHYFARAEELIVSGELLFLLAELSHDTYKPEQVELCLKFYLGQETDDQTRVKVFTSMLYKAISINQPRLARFLIKNGADYKREQCSPLYLAVICQSKLIVQFLIKTFEKIVEKQESKETRSSLMGAYLNGGDWLCQTPLMAALQKENFEIVELLVQAAVKQGCDLQNLLGYEDPLFGNTALKILVDMNRPSSLKAFVQILSNYDADLECCFNIGSPNDFQLSLPRAARCGNPKILKFLINGAHKHNVDLNLYLNMVSPNGNAALILLIKYDHTQAAKMLVKLAEKYNVYLQHRNQALSMAQAKENIEIVELLKQHMAKN